MERGWFLKRIGMAMSLAGEVESEWCGLRFAVDAMTHGWIDINNINHSPTLNGAGRLACGSAKTRTTYMSEFCAALHGHVGFV